jgi:hypothetical protein
MAVKDFEISFTHLGERIKATCQVINPQQYPQYRVSLLEENNKEIIFIFYKVDQVNRKFFWYEHRVKYEMIAKSIARALEKEV